jgi:hypothetical protein
VRGERLVRAGAEECRGRERTAEHCVWGIQGRRFELEVHGLYADAVFFVVCGKRIMSRLVAGGGSG